VWHCAKRAKGSFDGGQNGLDGFPIAFEGKVNGHARAAMAGAQPKIVGGNRSQL
jgi:hypothetical protein